MTKWGSFVLALIAIGSIVIIARKQVPQERRVASIPFASRSPASIEKVFDYSYLEGDTLKSAAQKRILSSINITKDNTDALIEVGNFVLLNDQKEKDFACGFYDQLSFSFVAEGMAVNGEKPELTVRSNCEISDNINNLIPIRVPVEKIKNQSPSESEFKFFDSKQSITVQFSNTSTDWPRKWVLKDVKLTHSQFSSRVLHVPVTNGNGTGTIIDMSW